MVGDAVGTVSHVIVNIVKAEPGGPRRWTWTTLWRLELGSVGARYNAGVIYIKKASLAPVEQIHHMKPCLRRLDYQTLLVPAEQIQHIMETYGSSTPKERWWAKKMFLSDHITWDHVWYLLEKKEHIYWLTFLNWIQSILRLATWLNIPALWKVCGIWRRKGSCYMAEYAAVLYWVPLLVDLLNRVWQQQPC